MNFCGVTYTFNRLYLLKVYNIKKKKQIITSYGGMKYGGMRFTW